MLRVSGILVLLFACTFTAFGQTPASQWVQPAEAGVAWDSGDFVYDESGNIAAIGDDQFSYDGVSRLTSATVHAYGVATSQTFRYDRYGNLLEIDNSPALTTFAVATATNRLNGACSPNRGCETWTYDPATGNQTRNVRSNGTSLYDVSYAWDAVGAMKELQSGIIHERYVYDANDERVVMVSLDQNREVIRRWTWRDASNKVAREVVEHVGYDNWSDARDYVYRNGTLLASFEAPASTTADHHYHTDHLGTPRLVTDGGRHKLALDVYLPFGGAAPGGESPYIGFQHRLRFTGHERDAENSPYRPTLDYMHARYYTAEWGRFLSVDPYLDVETTVRNPQMWNRYAYVTNNPLRYTDPTGQSLWETLFRVVRYIGREEKIVARVKAISKSKAMEGIERGIKVAREEKATSIAVVTESKQARNAVGKQLSESGKIRPPERSGIWPEHVNPADGPNADIHVQTVDATKSAGFGQSLGVGLLGIIGANTMAANANADATPGEVASAFLWDSAKAIDPIFLTDVIEHVTGADAYAEENPPE